MGVEQSFTFTYQLLKLYQKKKWKIEKKEIKSNAFALSFVTRSTLSNIISNTETFKTL